MELSCPLGTTQKCYNKSFIDQVCSAKTGYWLRSFFREFMDLDYILLDKLLPPFSLIRDLGKQTQVETFPKFPSVLRVIAKSDRNPPIAATIVNF